jgi:hypothetical protein
MFSFVEGYGFGKTHGDNVIKAVINVSYFVLKL